jgi:hypothetical protein
MPEDLAQPLHCEPVRIGWRMEVLQTIKTVGA